MKLAVVGPTFPFRGGIAHYTTLLVRALRERHRVELYAFRRLYARLLFPGSTAPDPSAVPLVEACTPTLDGLDPSSWFDTARRLVAERPDLLLLQWWTPYWLPLHLILAGRARAAGVPVLTIVHQLVEPDSCRAERPLARLALRSSDGLLVAGERDLRRVRRWFPARPVRTGRLPAFAHCAGEAPSRDEARRALGVSPEAQLLLVFGFVRRYKGLAVLLQALARVPEVQLLVAGSFWEEERSYREQVERLGLAGRVALVDRYIGNEEVARYLVAADALVLPYLAGSYSAVGTTALSYGLPIIASRVGGLEELVEDGVTGLLVEPRSSDQLARAVDRFFREGLAVRMGEAAAREGARRSWGSLVGVVEELAAELEERGTGGARVGTR